MVSMNYGLPTMTYDNDKKGLPWLLLPLLLQRLQYNTQIIIIINPLFNQVENH